MKVLMISLDSKISDHKSDSTDRIKKYAALAEELHVLTLGGHEGHWSDGNFFVYPAVGSSKISIFLAALKIGKEIIKTKKINVITAQDPFFTGLLGLILRRPGVGLNIEMHGDFYSSKFWHDYSPWWPFRLWLGKYVLRRADGIRVVSERQRKSLIEKLKITPEKIIKFPVFSGREIIVKEAAIDLHNKFHTPSIIMGVGSFRLEKNFSDAVKAMPRILESSGGANLILIGSGPEEKKLRSLVKKMELIDSVRFLEEMDRGKMFAYLKQADVVIIPSLSESWSRIAVEATALGVPVVMSDVGLAKEVIVGGVSGEVVGDFDPEKIAEAVSKILKDSRLRARYAAAAKEAILGLPDEEQTMNLIKNSWEKVAKISLLRAQ